ncbi:metal-dependent transcriptional regulator [Pseudonocardia acidicola]|uniref:Manganese transport regulator n=1 Tax=Pseudonocardia acidicola TaxID=2724939 RepID=A0ABX1S8B6_9PSEU|nr:metal-dependent transcriptional regulator [Pseudonocardia acidicola]NMH97794.1 metal-dependent transcriptional regulator [Pseudonocardia acidicola]
MVAISPAIEDYLKVIYGLSSRGETVTTGVLAQELGVSSPSVSAMMKRLEQGRLVVRPDSRQLQLTERGENAALRVVRRHRLLETYLATALGVPWDEVHAEAELLEHALSDRLEERIDAALGHPARDPHGDPIPPRHGRHDEAWGDPLDAAPAGCRFRVERVSDRDSAALRYLGELGIRPGAVLQVEEQAPFGGPRWVRVPSGDRHALGGPLTRLVHGRILPGAAEAVAGQAPRRGTE